MTKELSPIEQPLQQMEEIPPKSPSELEICRIFQSFDRNSDGFLSADETVNVLRLLGMAASKTEALKLIEKFDFETRDGCLSVEECRKLLKSKWAKSNREQELLESFRFVDKDDNGLLAQKEMRDSLALVAAKNDRERMKKEEAERQADEMIKIADRDMNGMIDFSEYVRATSLQPRWNQFEKEVEQVAKEERLSPRMERRGAFQRNPDDS